MSVTSKGRRWEILHSLWIGWTFTLGFFNWVAFLYIGLRARRARWAIWGVFYSVPFVLAMIFAGSPAFEGWIGDLTVALTLLLGLISIFHAFRVRKEYLIRLGALREGVTGRDESSRREVEREYAESVPEKEASDPASRPGSSHNRPKTSAPPGGEPRRPPNLTGPSPADLEPSSDNSTRVHPDWTSSLGDFPFPLAFGYGLLSSKWDPRDRYREQLRFAENILTFLASVSLVLLREEDREAADIDLEDYWRGGISPGDWKEIIGRCSKVFSTYEDQPLALSIQRLNIRSEKKSFGRDIAELIREKNDYKHDRGPTVEEDIVAASNEVQERLDRCMEALTFFTRYPIRLVQDFDVSRDGSRFIVKCLRYTGDGPGFPQEEIVFHQVLPRGDLFLDLGHQSWVSLYPFVTAMNCPRCKLREMYFIDGWNRRKSRVWLKSFERGHTEERSDISEALDEWGSGREPASHQTV